MKAIADSVKELQDMTDETLEFCAEEVIIRELQRLHNPSYSIGATLQCLESVSSNLALLLSASKQACRQRTPTRPWGNAEGSLEKLWASEQACRQRTLTWPWGSAQDRLEKQLRQAILQVATKVSGSPCS